MYTFEDLMRETGASRRTIERFITASKATGLWAAEHHTLSVNGHSRNFYTDEFLMHLRGHLLGTQIRTTELPVSETQPTASEKAQPKDQVLETILKHAPCEVSDLANYLNCSPRNAEESVRRLIKQGHALSLFEDEVQVKRQLTQATGFRTPRWLTSGERYKIGLISDTHYANRHAKLESVKAAYDYFEQAGCAFVLHCGDIVDGPPSMHKGFEYELCLTSLDEQMDFVREHHPKNLPTWFFGGNHDGAWLKQAGYSVAWNLCKDSPNDWFFGGDIDGFIAGPNGEPTFMYVLHPGGGSAYSTSYKAQKVDEYLGQALGALASSVEERDAIEHPRFSFMGHFHKRCYVPGADESSFYLIPASCDVTAFQRQHHIINHTGALLLEFGLDDRGHVDHEVAEWIRYPFGDEISYTKAFTRPRMMVNSWRS